MCRYTFATDVAWPHNDNDASDSERKQDEREKRERGGGKRKIEHETANIENWRPRRRSISVASA